MSESICREATREELVEYNQMLRSENAKLLEEVRRARSENETLKEIIVRQAARMAGVMG